MTEFDSRVRQVRPDQWGSSTPCKEWSVHDLVNHLVYEQLWAPELLAGCTVEQVGDRFDGDQLGDDPVRSWVLAAAAAREAWISPKALIRPVHLSGGRSTSVEYGWQMTLDLGVHAWDLARAIGADERLDPDLARTLLEYAREHLAEFAGSGIFGPSVPVPDDASDQDRLVALLGRTP
ncbi:TIGR03086 family metal-binding protein [Actinosynnema sp. NPDC047251]|uniref:TIGR03086 family metal-binding protein n=1 Tax=Saccharothrix espanaensis TaxID=103731 RepID=UPI001568D878|nr:TIGR03086 family metal-binding protein [Saccharothrix espanaensis]